MAKRATSTDRGNVRSRTAVGNPSSEQALAHPHDAIIKRLLAPQARAAALLKVALPAEVVAQLNLDALERDDALLMAAGLAPTQPDLLFRVPILGGGEALLAMAFEHQSRSDRWMAWRMQRTLHRIQARHRAEHPRDRRLRPAIGVVLAHGRRRWTAPNRLHALYGLKPQVEAALAPFLPGLAYPIFDLWNVDDAQLREGVSDAVVGLTLLFLKHAQASADFELRLSQLGDLVRAVFVADSGADALAALIDYAFRVRPVLDPGTVIDIMQTHLGRPGKELTMTAADRLMEQGHARGLAEGKAEGKAQGKAEGKAETLVQIIRYKFGAAGAAFDARIKAASAAQLERLTELIIDADNLDTLDRALSGR